MKKKKENLEVYKKIFGPQAADAIRTGKVKVSTSLKDIKDASLKGGAAGALIGGTVGTLITGNPIGGVVAGGLMGATKGAIMGPELSAAAAVKTHKIANMISKKYFKKKR